MSGGKSEKKTDFWGNEYIQHYDDRGQPIGRSEKKTDFWGNEYTQHYDNRGQETGRSEEKTDFWGSSYTQHYDNRGRETGKSEEKTDFWGSSYTQHYNNRGQEAGRSEQKTDFWGSSYTQHTGTSGSQPISPPPSSSQNSDSDVEYLGGIFAPVYMRGAASPTPVDLSGTIISNFPAVSVTLFLVGLVMLFATTPLLRLYSQYSSVFLLVLGLYAVVSPIICLFSRCKKYGLSGDLKKAIWWMAAADCILLLTAIPLFPGLLFPGSVEHFVDFLRTARFWLALPLYALVLGLITVFTVRKAGEQASNVRSVANDFYAHAVCSFTALYGIVIHMATRIGDSSGWFLWTLSIVLLFFFLLVVVCVICFVSNIPYVICCKYPKKKKN